MAGFLRPEHEPGLVRGHDLAEWRHVAHDERPLHGHRLERLERGHEGRDAVGGAGDDEQVDDRVVGLHVVVRDAPRHDERAVVEAEAVGQLHERLSVAAIADEQQSQPATAGTERGDRFDEVADPLVRRERGDVADDVLVGPDPEACSELIAARDRLEALDVNRVRDHDDVLRLAAARDDLEAHRLRQRDDRVRGGHDAGFGGTDRLVTLGLARSILVAFRVRRPRLLDEASDLVDDRDPERLGECQRDLRLEVVRRRVEDGRPDLLDELQAPRALSATIRS